MREALRVATFRRLLISYAGDEAGDWFVAIAAAVLVFDQTSSALATTALFLCNRFAPAFFVPAIVARLDHFRPARSLAALYAIDAIVIAGLAWSTESFSLALVCALAFADGVLAATGRAITRSATAAVMAPLGMLRSGNALLNLSFGSVNIAAPAIAGLLIAVITVQGVFIIGCGIFLALSAVMLTTAGPAGMDDTTNWIARLTSGTSAILGDRRIRYVLILEAALLVLFSMVTPIEIVYAKESLDAGNAGYGALVSTWGAGMVVGGLIFTRLLARSMVRILVVASLLVGLSYVAMAVSPTLLIACMAAVVGGIGNGMQWVTVVTAVQESLDDDMQTRAASILEAVGTAMPGLGFIAGGVGTELFAPRPVFAAAGIAVVVVVVVFAGAWVARIRPQATAAPL